MRPSWAERETEAAETSVHRAQKNEVALDKTVLPEDLTEISKAHIKGLGNPSVLLNGFLELHQSEKEPYLISQSIRCTPERKIKLTVIKMRVRFLGLSEGHWNICQKVVH